ncbi:hypothetical protein D3C80_2107400 [compost metagenome]
MQAEGRMRVAQLNKTLVILEDRHKCLFILPAYGIDGIWAAVAVMITVFTAQNFIPGMQKRDALRGKNQAISQQGAAHGLIA